MTRFDASALTDRLPESHRARLALLGLLAGVGVWIVSTTVFPHYSTNHDEAVYLQQAEMLIDGQLYLNPPVEDAFRPWFFVESDDGLYPKYLPPTAAMFAVGKLLGGFRIALGLIAAGCAILTQVTVAEAFDERTGWVATILLLPSPLFLVQSATFLPYVPALFWSLAFAAAYLRADRTGSYRYAAVAGLAIAIAFFARPFTAVLFAAPFIVHALWTLRSLEREPIVRQSVTAVVGLLGPIAALSYNAYVTGDPLLFPYEAFAPLDGLGWGRRELLGYTVDYTPTLGMLALRDTLWVFATRWFVGGLVGTALLFVGVAAAVRRGLDARKAAIAGLFPSIALGYTYFWGTYNVMGELGVGGDGLGAPLGPYYHVGLLLPASAFAAVGVLASVRWLRETIDHRFDAGRAPRVSVAVFVVGAAVLGGAGVVAAAVPLADNAEITRQLDAAYEPFEDRNLDDSVVFLPTPHGDWLNHPIQRLRNDPDYDEGPIYALRERQFAVVDAFPDRSYNRYTYHGPWAPTAGDPVRAHLQPVTVTEGESVTHRFRLGVPTYAERVSLRLASDEEVTYASVPVGNETTVTPTVNVSRDSATLSAENTTASGTETGVAIDHREALELHAFVDYGTGAGFSYRADLPVQPREESVRTLTPYVEVCTDAFTCDGEAAYVPGAHREYVRVDLSASARP